MKTKFENLKIILIYGLFLPTFGLAAFDKFSGPVPDWFIKQFQNTILNDGPGGVIAPYYGLATLEATTTLVFMISFLKGEFKSGKNKNFLNAALILSMTTFCILGFGLRLSRDFNQAFQLFGYFILTYLLTDKVNSVPV